MDLGFGKSNQNVGSAAARSILQASRAQEKAIEDEIDRYDHLLHDEDALEQMRAKRLEEMKRASQQKQEWKSNGHGRYTEIGLGQNSQDIAKEFFEATKKSERLVVHFYRPTTAFCDVYHRHLEKLAPMHLETRFLKMNVEGCDQRGGSGGSYLVEKLGIHILPTLLIVKNRKVVHHIRGFDEMGSEQCSTASVAYVLGVHGAINRDNEDVPADFLEHVNKGVNRITLQR